MKTIIAGSRGVTHAEIVEKAILLSQFDITEVVSGTARGVDQLGEAWAEKNHIPIRRFPADWDTFGKSAGMIRNKQMAEYADALIAIWDGESKGTLNMIHVANRLGLKVYIHEESL